MYTRDSSPNNKEDEMPERFQGIKRMKENDFSDSEDESLDTDNKSAALRHRKFEESLAEPPSLVHSSDDSEGEEDCDS